MKLPGTIGEGRSGQFFVLCNKNDSNTPVDASDSRQNINRRIWLGYGGDSGLTIDSTEGEGFTVKLKLRLGGM